MRLLHRFFCAVASRDGGEEIFGTVALTRSWLLLEYPAAWRRNAVEDSRLLSAATKEYIRAAADRTIVIRQSHRWSSSIRCFRVECCADPPAISCMTLDDFDSLPGNTAPRQPVPGPIYAACTHARHDKCCAKFGLPVFCALRDTVGEQAWECSHIGGDRFAGNVVVFPWGLYYGRVRPEDTPDLVRATGRGEVWLPGFRGRCCHNRRVQVAEYFARVESGRLGISEFVPLEAGPGRMRFLARSDGSLHDVEYETDPAGCSQRLTCSAETPSLIAQHRLLRYRMTPSNA